MPDLCAVCGVCGEPVDGKVVSAHMDAHGLLLPQDWVLATWPDGVAILVNPETGGPA